MLCQKCLDNLNLSTQLAAQKDQLDAQNNLITLQSGMVDMLVH